MTIRSVVEVLQSCVFVEGTACVGKSSALRGLENAYVGDYQEDVARFPLYGRKRDWKYAAKLYTSYLLLRLKAESFYDRCFISDYVYEVIFDMMRGSMAELEGGTAALPEAPAQGLRFSEAEVEQCMEAAMGYIEPEIQAVLRSMHVVVCVDPDEEDVLARMEARRNGIDVCSTDYVYYQNCAFRYLARRFEWKLLERRRGESVGEFVARTRRTCEQLRVKKG